MLGDTRGGTQAAREAGRMGGQPRWAERAVAGGKEPGRTGCTTSTRGRPLENLCILTKPDSILQSVRFLPVFVGARRKIRCPRPARQALLR